MQLPAGKKIYFASDFHFGIPDRASSTEREKRICRWLDEIAPTAEQIFLVGDLFDTWFEYKNVVPRGFTRFLGKIAELRDKGLHIEVFTGNHDLWMLDYFHTEFGIPVHHGPITREVNGKKFFIAHGDGLGPGDTGYKILKTVLRSPLSQWLYRRVHPDTGVGLAGWFSRLGPKHADIPEKEFLGPDREMLVQFCLETLKHHHYDYFVFGHRHIAIEFPLSANSLYVNLGDWIRYDSYGEFDGDQLRLQYYGK
ncbi:MAG: UDP-2,3-diacylglucosamine diphosphatase [Chitinophagaceae bacterium]|nr:UDP-2,3-diacylglucosamine diphosphatase [Chitinophagaceae bacterium]